MGRQSPFVFAILALALVSLSPTHAYHEKNEPSDGTVRSFKPVDPPAPLPEHLGILDAEKQPVAMSEFRGKVVLVNLGATWCPPCVRELPALDRLQKRLGGEDFMVLPVSLDEGGTVQAAPFYQRLKILYLGLYGDAGLGAFFPTDVLPANFIIDRQGRVTHFLRSYVDWDAPESDALFTDLIRQGRSDIPGSNARDHAHPEASVSN